MVPLTPQHLIHSGISLAAVLAGRTAHGMAKGRGEVLHGGETQPLADIGDGEICGSQELRGGGHARLHG